MDMTRFYREEDFFPQEFAAMTERPWGYLFCNPDNRDSYDSNHALIFRDRVEDLPSVLKEIADFYLSRGIHPVIYQSICDDGWFGEIAPEMERAGFRSWLEEQTWMVLREESRIVPEPSVDVRLESVWRESFGVGVFEAAGEPWEIPVLRRQMQNSGTRCFVARLDGKPVGLIYGHVNGENVCRIDYLLTAADCRRRGVGRALTHAFARYCREAQVACALWPDGETPRRIYEEAGFRFVERRFAGRASWHAES